MNKQPEALQQLIVQLQHIPYVASKNVHKIAHYLLQLDDIKRQQILGSIQLSCQQLSRCTVCSYWVEREGDCCWCSDITRDQRIICVVQEWYDVTVFEKAGGYGGVYHILRGVLSPLEGVQAHHLNIKALVDRVATPDTFEIIFALSQTPEGEATNSYLAKSLQRAYPEQNRIRISCLSQGVPVGTSFDHLDRITLSKALSERRPW